jgi:hypothetical protein
MTRSKSKNLPRFRSLDELVKFFDTHDLGEYWTEMPEVHFEVDIKRKTHLFALDAELANKLTEISISREISSEALINAWLKEKIQEQIRGKGGAKNSA